MSYSDSNTAQATTQENTGLIDSLQGFCLVFLKVNLQIHSRMNHTNPTPITLLTQDMEARVQDAVSATRSTVTPKVAVNM
jgi:hypothetical protein